MRRNKMHKEQIKTLLLILLSISAVFLGLRTGLFDEPLRAGGFGGAAPMRTVTDSVSPAAFPKAIMISLGEGAYHGQRMDGQGGTEDGLSTLYAMFTAHLGEALETAEPSAPVSIEAWKRAP
jgi:hypothetical protein